MPYLEDAFPRVGTFRLSANGLAPEVGMGGGFGFCLDLAFWDDAGNAIALPGAFFPIRVTFDGDKQKFIDITGPGQVWRGLKFTKMALQSLAAPGGFGKPSVRVTVLTHPDQRLEGSGDPAPFDGTTFAPQVVLTGNRGGVVSQVIVNADGSLEVAGSRGIQFVQDTAGRALARTGQPDLVASGTLTNAAGEFPATQYDVSGYRQCMLEVFSAVLTGGTSPTWNIGLVPVAGADATGVGGTTLNMDKIGSNGAPTNFAGLAGGFLLVGEGMGSNAIVDGLAQMSLLPIRLRTVRVRSITTGAPTTVSTSWNLWGFP